MVICQRKVMDIETLYQAFYDEFKFANKDSKRNSWRKWTGAVVDAAKFVSDFKDAEDFRNFVQLFSYNKSTRMALPLLISAKIKGIGFLLHATVLKSWDILIIQSRMCI